MQPPKVAERLLRWLVGGRDADAVSGDLRETFAERGGGRFWYWRQALSCVAVRLSPHRRMLPGLGMDFHYALRMIRRNPGYALTAMLCLALAMGVNTTLFSFLNSMYFRKLPVPEADRIVRITGSGHFNFTLSEDRDVRDTLRTLDPAAHLLTFRLDTVIDRVGFPVNAEYVSPNYAQVLRLDTAVGRWFSPAIDTGPAELVVVVSHRLWQTRLHGDRAAIGRQIRMYGKFYRVLGVARPDFLGTVPPFVADVWVMVPPSSARAGGPATWIARLTPGSTLRGAAAEMRVLASHLPPDPENNGPPRPVRVEPFTGFDYNQPFRPLLTILSVVSAAVLLIACVNVANLLLSRAVVRRQEMAVRRSLGASPARLFRATLAEGLVLAAGGVALGLAAGYAAGRALAWALPSVPVVYYHGIQLGIDWRVALVMAAVGVASAVLFSLSPAIGNSRPGPRPSRQRDLYSFAQVSLSLALLIAAALLLRGLQHIERIDPGFATDHRLVVFLRADLKPQQATPLVTTLLRQARALPGVLDATTAWDPMRAQGPGCASKSSATPPQDVGGNLVDPNYFDMMRVPILTGRGFPPTDAFTSTPTLVVNETMARTWWPGENPVGKTLYLGCDDEKRQLAQVIGVAGDTRNPAAAGDLHPAMYRSRLQTPDNGSFGLIVHTSGDPYLWSKPLMAIALSTGPNLHIFDIESMDDLVGRLLWEAKWQTALLGSLGLLAAVLAAIGLYGVVAYSVSQRTREIGVRMAVGATPGDVQWMVLGHGLRITAAGIAAGLLLSAATVRFLRSYLYGLSPFDPIAFAGASLAWVIISMLASWYPARRATRLNPLSALKYE